MLINTKYDFIFHHLMKNGGTSVTRELMKMEDTTKVPGYKHSSLAYIGKEASLDIESFKNSFAIVRNPWDRMHSLYYYINHKFRTPKFFKKGNDLRSRMYVFLQDQYTQASTKSFSDWLITSNYINPKDKSKTTSDTKFSQVKLMISEDGQIHIKNIFHMGDPKLVEYLNDISEGEINITKLKKLNITKHRPDYRTEYTTESREFIEHYFKDDIDMFGFEF